MKLDWGSDLAALAPIEDAICASHGKPDDRQQLENHLIAALKEKLARDAQDYVCRKLAIVGSAAAVPVLAGLLLNKDNSHMARNVRRRNRRDCTILSRTCRSRQRAVMFE